VHDELLTPEEAAALIRGGGALLLAGDEAVLRQLPAGDWIGGTIPYFMTRSGGRVDRERVFVNALPEGLRCRSVRRYGDQTISSVFADLGAGCFGVMIAPASSAVHLSYALHAPTFPRFAARPIVGWISGVHLSELGTRSAKVFDGTTGQALEQEAVVMQVELPPGKAARLGIVNIFAKGDGPAITFPANGFSAREVEVDGVRRNLAAYVAETGLDTRLPLVADYCGLDINVSFQTVDQGSGEVKFYAPVFSGVEYHHARPITDYVAQFDSMIPQHLNGRMAFSCNCILNFLHSNLEGKRTGEVAGPITFGEVAYQLLNQTMAYVTVVDAARERTAPPSLAPHLHGASTA
jgi:hypothetical protein